MGAGLIDRGVVRSRDGGRLVGGRRRLWRSARQHWVRRVIAQSGAAGKRQEDWYRIFGLPNQTQGERVGRMHKNRDGESHFATGSLFPTVAAPPGLTRPGGAVASYASAVALRRSEGAKPPHMSAFEPLHLFGQYPQRPVDLDVLVYALDGAGTVPASVGRAGG